jgi:dephospho-CoA kinase
VIIGLSGYARSGKDTVAELLVLNYGFKRMAFADGIREALSALNPILHDGMRLNEVVKEYGWELAKSKDEVRRLLQVLGTEVGMGVAFV